MRISYTRARKWVMIMAAGGGLFVLEACDSSVRDTVLSGMGSAASGLAGTFIQAFFDSIKNKADDSDQPLVQASDPIPDVPPGIFA